MRPILSSLKGQMWSNGQSEFVFSQQNVFESNFDKQFVSGAEVVLQYSLTEILRKFIYVFFHSVCELFLTYEKLIIFRHKP